MSPVNQYGELSNERLISAALDWTSEHITPHLVAVPQALLEELIRRVGMPGDREFGGYGR